MQVKVYSLRNPYLCAVSNPLFTVHGVRVPNPDAIKFVANGLSITSGAWRFTSAAEAAGLSPLAEELFQLPFVEQVFIAQNFVTVTRKPGGLPDWEEIMPQLRILIRNHLAGEVPVVPADSSSPLTPEPIEGDLASQIQYFIHERVKPATRQDGGEMSFASVSDGVVKVSLAGACQRCPYAPRTIKAGIEVLVKQAFPEIKEVTSDEVDWSQTEPE